MPIWLVEIVLLRVRGRAAADAQTSRRRAVAARAAEEILPAASTAAALSGRAAGSRGTADQPRGARRVAFLGLDAHPVVAVAGLAANPPTAFLVLGAAEVFTAAAGDAMFAFGTAFALGGTVVELARMAAFLIFLTALSSPAARLVERAAGRSGADVSLSFWTALVSIHFV
jgi:hypothetical protein